MAVDLQVTERLERIAINAARINRLALDVGRDDRDTVRQKLREDRVQFFQQKFVQGTPLPQLSDRGLRNAVAHFEGTLDDESLEAWKAQRVTPVAINIIVSSLSYLYQETRNMGHGLQLFRVYVEEGCTFHVGDYTMHVEVLRGEAQILIDRVKPMVMAPGRHEPGGGVFGTSTSLGPPPLDYVRTLDDS